MKSIYTNPKDKSIDLETYFNTMMELNISSYVSKEEREKLAKAFKNKVAEEFIESNILEPQLKRHIGNVEPKICQLEFWFKVQKQ